MRTKIIKMTEWNELNAFWQQSLAKKSFDTSRFLVYFTEYIKVVYENDLINKILNKLEKNNFGMNKSNISNLRAILSGNTLESNYKAVCEVFSSFQQNGPLGRGIIGLKAGEVNIDIFISFILERFPRGDNCSEVIKALYDPFYLYCQRR